MNKKLLIVIPLLVIIGVIAFRFATHTTLTAIPKESTNSENLRHLTLKIDGMYCVSCPYNVENALKDASGVANVTVGFIGKEIVNGTVEGRGEVIYDPSRADANKLIQAISPYKGTVISDKEAISTQLTPLSKTFKF